MSEAGERWAPFPVQDWSTMPPGARAADPVGSPVDPAWGPPAPGTHVPAAPVPPLPVPAAQVPPPPAPPAGPARPWWVPLVVLLCLGLVVGTGTWLARREPEPRTAALSYVPPDGDALWQRRDVTRESVTETTTQVTESARFAGSVGLLSGDDAVLSRLLHQDIGADHADVRLWRATTTTVDDVGVPTQSLRYYRVRGSVELAGEQGPDGTTAYEPALVELPADVGPGSTWTGAGSAGDTLDYTSSFRAAAGRDGCLDVSGELDLRTKGSQQLGRRSTLTRTWCPGRGLVASSESAGDVLTVLAPTAAPGPGTPTTADAPISWSDPSGWTPRTWGTVTVDATGATSPMYGSPKTSVTPVLTASGLVVRAQQPPDDLVATTPKTIDAWTPVWAVHPGGTIVSLAAFGSVVVVTTSDRTMVAYSEAGQRLWRVALPEIGPNPPVRVSDADAVLVDLSGRALRFGIADGAVRWEQSLGADVSRAAAAGAGLVVVADRSGTVTALDAATGTTRWTRQREGLGVAVVGGTVLVVEDQSLIGLEAAAGTTRFVTHFDGLLTEVTGFTGRPVLVGRSATLLLDPAGRVTQRLPGYLAVDVTQTHLVGWGADRLDVHDPAGRLVASWPTRSTSLVSSDRPGLATPQGVYLFGFTKDWTFDSWTTGG